MILPTANTAEATALPELHVLPAHTLLDVIRHLAGQQSLQAARAQADNEALPAYPLDMADIRGQQQARKALEVAAAGVHTFMSGPLGVGKSILAQRLPGILPALTRQQALEVMRIYSVAQDHSRPPMSRIPPFRQPHHSASDVAIIGGGCHFHQFLQHFINRCDKPFSSDGFCLPIEELTGYHHLPMESAVSK